MPGLRILMLTHNVAGTGGSFMRSFSLAQQLTMNGHDVTLLASSAGQWPATRVVSGVRVVQMADPAPYRLRHGGLSPFDLLGRLRYVGYARPDIIHAFDHRPCVSLPALLGRQQGSAPFISDWADLWGVMGIASRRRRMSRLTLGRLDHLWERWLRRLADGVTAISTYLRDLARSVGVPDSTIRLLPPGANIDQIRPLDRVTMRRRHGLPEHGHIVVHSGYSLHDGDLLAETFVALARRDRSALLLMTGGPAAPVVRRVAAAGFGPRLVHKGAVPYRHLGELLACGDVMLLPYRQQQINLARYPNKIGDYLAAGRPVVSNSAGDLGRLIQEEQVGVLAAESGAAMAEATLALLDSPALCAEIGARARHVAETRLAWSVRAREVEVFYDTLRRAHQ